MFKLKYNIGISNKEQTIEEEVEKIKNACDLNVEYVSHISIYKDMIIPLWEAIKEYSTKTCLCGVPLYESVLFNESIIDVIKRYKSYGVKAITLHTTDMKILIDAKNSGFKINSRGGMFLHELYEKDNNVQNPILENIDEILEYMKDNNMKLFIGTSLRAGKCFSDFTYIEKELVDAVGLYNYAVKKYKLDVEIETFGHINVSEFDKYYKILENIPLCTMGPLQVDSVNGFDDLNALYGLTRAIDFGFKISTECILTRAEHLHIPDAEDGIDAIKKFNVWRHIIGCEYSNKTELEKQQKVMNIKNSQNTQCSAYVNIFGEMNVNKHCNVCGEHCPLEKIK